MQAFPNQLTTHGGHGCQALVWTRVPFYLKVYFYLKQLKTYTFRVIDA